MATSLSARDTHKLIRYSLRCAVDEDKLRFFNGLTGKDILSYLVAESCAGEDALRSKYMEECMRAGMLLAAAKAAREGLSYRRRPDGCIVVFGASIVRRSLVNFAEILKAQRDQHEDLEEEHTHWKEDMCGSCVMHGGHMDLPGWRATDGQSPGALLLREHLKAWASQGPDGRGRSRSNAGDRSVRRKGRRRRESSSEQPSLSKTALRFVMDNPSQFDVGSFDEPEATGEDGPPKASVSFRQPEAHLVRADAPPIRRHRTDPANMHPSAPLSGALHSSGPPGDEPDSWRADPDSQPFDSPAAAPELTPELGTTDPAARKDSANTVSPTSPPNGAFAEPRDYKRRGLSPRQLLEFLRDWVACTRDLRLRWDQFLADKCEQAAAGEAGDTEARWYATVGALRRRSRLRPLPARALAPGEAQSDQAEAPLPVWPGWSPPETIDPDDPQLLSLMERAVMEVPLASEQAQAAGRGGSGDGPELAPTNVAASGSAGASEGAGGAGSSRRPVLLGRVAGEPSWGPSEAPPEVSGPLEGIVPATCWRVCGTMCIKLALRIFNTMWEMAHPTDEAAYFAAACLPGISPAEMPLDRASKAEYEEAHGGLEAASVHFREWFASHNPAAALLRTTIPLPAHVATAVGLSPSPSLSSLRSDRSSVSTPTPAAGQAARGSHEERGRRPKATATLQPATGTLVGATAVVPSAAAASPPTRAEEAAAAASDAAVVRAELEDARVQLRRSAAAAQEAVDNAASARSRLQDLEAKLAEERRKRQSAQDKVRGLELQVQQLHQKVAEHEDRCRCVLM